MGYQPIENYGIIGNMRTTALVGLNGSIDWFCYPRHDSPSMFAALVDEQKGGYFKIESTVDGDNHKQFYLSETNVLVTRFLCDCGVGEVTDFMPVGTAELHPWIVRQVKTVRQEIRFRMECYPAFDYARQSHKTELTEQGAVFTSDSGRFELVTEVPLEVNEKGVWAEFTLSECETATFVFRESSEQGETPNPEMANRLFETTVTYWRKWLSQSVYKGRWRRYVERSALALKLMTYEPTGAIIAAPTSSLPEQIGGERNWDYRYTWIRDAAFTVYALMRLGFTQEAADFMRWLEARCQELGEGGSLQTMYRVDGRLDLDEEQLDLAGYRGSQPVRLGNGAYQQLQLDICGELMDSAYLFNKYGTPISYDFWVHLRYLTNWVCDNWQQADQGVWESRGGPKHHVYSRLMCWVTVDRALRLAEKRSFPAERQRWYQVRDEIYEEILEKGWSEDRQSFVQAYGQEDLDAGCLIMPLVFFMSPTDPRMIKTLDAVMASPQQGGLTSNSLVYRYNPSESGDGISGEEGTFNLCTFWLVEALTRAGASDPDKLTQARRIFEEMLTYANPLGLYAEETSISGTALGNFPQAFTHIALISAAWNLDEALDGKA
ncbi:glycoside hydrolase family 15 protein [Romeria aff. gracilis LEGE 07310]|uniref:Glycoside hydrolase family 15 protein n=1 Tax=Vasconcelosia minhoensis LEGE 07310 TaxID=915328 RepID=A0A8J7AIL6_9CYAN|nr:glycoside hydrolase family 15 protein [Romeria gracilis]MBE9079751.1 glycoside hydrolase family 15 protein [Romeria aff. gracilis LEGE 07310]